MTSSPLFSRFGCSLFLSFFPAIFLCAELHAQQLGDPLSLTADEIEALTGPAQSAPPPPPGVPGVPVSGFTIENTNRNCVAAGYQEFYLASEGYAAVMAWTGDVSTCTPGTVSAEFQDKTLRRINYYRAQVGLPADIYFDSAKNSDCQEAAVIMAYQNGLSHTPAADWPTNPCLTTGGNAAAGAGNLSLGSFGPGSIDRLILDDKSNNAVAGHRRWLLYQRAKEMGNGSVPPIGTFPYTLPEHPSTDCVWVIGNFNPAPPPEAVTWPNEGYVPWQLVPDDGEDFPRWSYSYPGAGFSGATVTMTQGATAISVVQETVSTGSGDNTIVWRPAGIPDAAPASDTTYTVSITGITGAPFTSATYDVTVIDPFAVNDPPVVTGPASPFAGIDNTYNFTPTDKAEAYELCIFEVGPGGWLEGAETSPAPQVVDNTDAGYALLSSSYADTGSRSFHLATPAFGASDSFMIDRDVVPGTGSAVLFDYRRFFMHPDTKLRVELSTDSGATFNTIHTIDGQNSSGSSGDWDPAFIPAAISIPASYHDTLVRIRLRLEPTGLTFIGSSSTIGLHIDDVEVSNSSELLNPAMQTLTGTASSFDFDPGAAGQDFRLSVRPQLGGNWFIYGPALDVTSVTLPAPVITSASSANGIQGAVFSYFITAINAPASYGATGLPAGATVNPVTGEITGQMVPGTHTGITISATNATGTGTAPLSITVLTGYEKWVADNFPGLGPPGADDDGDGATNFMEAAIAGMNPTVADHHLLPTSAASGGDAIVTASKSGVAGIGYWIEGSGTMAAGSWTTTGITIVTDDASTIVGSYPLSSALKYFLRLGISQNNDPTL